MKKNITPALFLACMMACLSATAQKVRMTLQPDHLVITCESKYTALANDFALHLKLIAGKDITVNPATAAQDAYVIHLGQVPQDDHDPLKPEEGRWAFQENEAFFYGEGGYGIKHAVYAFLEDELNVRWPTGDDIVVKPATAFKIYRLSASWIPQLKGREIRPGNGKGVNAKFALWQDRLRWGYNNVAPFGHAFTAWWNRFGKTHPEYFALNNGKRFPVPIHGRRSEDPTIPLAEDASMYSICPSNPGVVTQIVKDWNKKLPYINICENDAPAKFACHCEKCLALDPHPSQDLTNDMGADRYVFMANNVLKEASKLNPDVKVAMYAYNASEQPSVNIKMDPRIVLGIVPTDFRLDILKSYVEGWANSGMKEFKYRPNRHHYFCPMGFPLGCERHFFQVFQTMRKLGANVFDYDAPSKYDIFRWHGDYILQHAMLDPDAPFEYWEKHFADAYADAASQEITDYFRYWMTVWDKAIYPELDQLANRANWHYFSRAFVKSGAVGGYYTQNDFAASGKFIDAALAKPGLSAGARSRITALKEFHDHAALMLTAIQTGTIASKLKVIQFRATHNMPETMPYETEYGDFCGLKIDKQLLAMKGELIDTPLYWNFRFDWYNVGETKHWFNQRDLAKWDGMLPTDCTWEHPKFKRPYPTPEHRKLLESFDGAIWYACDVELPLSWKAGYTIDLCLSAVNDDADVWVNGKKIGKRRCKTDNDVNVIFSFKANNAIDWKKKLQRVVVKVTDYEGNGGIAGRVYFVGRPR